MARKKKHEDHVNHEAWAIPYGDLVTLLFALFTVMYAMSSVNEGKFRVLSDAMIAAFNGAPKSMRPLNIGEKEPGKGGEKPLIGITPTALIKIKSQDTVSARYRSRRRPKSPGSLIRMEREVQDAMRALIDAKLITVKPREHVAGNRNQHRHPVSERLGRVLEFRGTGARQARGGAEALSQSDPRRGPYRRSPDPHRRFSLQLGIVGSAGRERRASVHQAGHRSAAGSRSSASASFTRARRILPPRGATRIAASRCWCWRP